MINVFIFRAVAGSCIWKRSNKNPITLTKTPITGLEDGEAYFFRVRAFNRWGQGPASLPVGPIAMRDSGTFRHPMGKTCFITIEILITSVKALSLSSQNILL